MTDESNPFNMTDAEHKAAGLRARPERRVIKNYKPSDAQRRQKLLAHALRTLMGMRGQTTSLKHEINKYNAAHKDHVESQYVEMRELIYLLNELQSRLERYIPEAQAINAAIKQANWLDRESKRLEKISAKTQNESDPP